MRGNIKLFFFIVVIVTNLFTLLNITIYPKNVFAQFSCPNTCPCGCNVGTSVCRSEMICSTIQPPPAGGCTGGNQCPGGCCIGETCQTGAICGESSCPANYSMYCNPWPRSGNLACSTIATDCPYFAGDASRCKTICTTTAGLLDLGTGNICKSFPTYVFRRDCSLCYCKRDCDLTPPTITGVVPIPESQSANIQWIPGIGSGTYGYQIIYVGANETEVNAGCPGLSSPACVVNTNLANYIDAYNTGVGKLQASTVYHVKIVNYKNSSCNTSSATSSFLSSCYLTPTQFTGNTNDQQVFTLQVNPSNKITGVNFSSTDVGVATISPASDSTSVDGYTTTATLVGTSGSANINSSVTINGYAPTCTPALATIQGSPSSSWWKVIDGDVITNGNLQSSVVNPNKFMGIGLGEYPGIPIYGGTFNLSSTPNLISDAQFRWQANTTTTTTRLFNYAYFESLIPTGINSGDIVDGYQWYLFNGTSLNATDYLNRKVIIFVDGDLVINGNLNVTDGQGFLGIFVSGNIIIDPAVTQLEGIYLANGNFSTGLGSTALNVRGSVVSYGTVNLARTLVNNTNASEIFTFAPDQILLFPPELMFSRARWNEVAP